MSTAADWFIDEHEFRQLCGDAQSQARGESGQDFAAEMIVKAKEHGLKTFLSVKQREWLCKLADWDVPKRIADNTGMKKAVAMAKAITDQELAGLGDALKRNK